MDKNELRCFILREMQYFDIYVLCQAATRLLDRDFARNANDFFEPLFEGDGFRNHFSKCSLLHAYCEWIVGQNAWDEDENIVKIALDAYRMKAYASGKGTLWIDLAIKYYCHADYDFLDWISDRSSKTVDQMTDTEINDLHFDYLQEIQLGDDYDLCVDRMSREMFYILFQNRGFIYSFNLHLAMYNRNKRERIPIPKWVQRAVFFRDHGCCVFCGKDLSGIINITGDREIHFDHIVPLSENGMNDVSNIQLSCQECNLHKSSKGMTSIQYQQWYEMDKD